MNGSVTAERGSLCEFLGRRQHPFKILGYTSKTLWLLAIPIIKNIAVYRFDIKGWISTYWLDLIMIVSMLGFAVFRWLFVFYRIEDDGITAHFGPFGIMRKKIYFSEITSFSTVQGYVYRLVNACVMYIETNANSVPKTDLKLLLSEKSVDKIYSAVTAASEGEVSFSVSPKKRELLIFSLIFSSTVSGIVLFAAFTYELYRLVGQELETQLFERVNGKLTEIDQKYLGISRMVPDSILLLSGLIAGGWLISFISNLMAHWQFTVTRRGRQLIITSGLITRRRSVLSRDKINCFDIRQTLLMKMWHISSVHVSCTGYGVHRGQSSALIPITTNREMTASMRMIEPEQGHQRTGLKTGKKDTARFIMMPVICCFVPVAAGTVLKMLLDRWHSEINILMLVSTLPLIWLVAVKAAASRLTSVGMTSDTCTLCYCRGFEFHKVIINTRNITKTEVTQSIIQKFGGTCTLKIYTDSERRKVHKVSRLRYNELMALGWEQLCTGF